MHTRIGLGVACALTLSLMWATSVRAVLPQQEGDADLLVQGNVLLDGAAAGDMAGSAVAAAGDVNGDGVEDTIVGSPWANGDRGAAYVVFGGAATADVDLATLGANGFRIDGAADGDFSGFSVGGAGDVNGDGLDDVIVGAPSADNRGRNFSGSAYVVFGKASTTPVSLASLGSGGFRIDGAAAGDEAGASVAGAGDLDGDGRDDVIVGADGADHSGSNAGAAYVVFAPDSTAAIDLGALRPNGFQIDGANPGDGLGGSVAGTGDVNGDGTPDVIVGADYYGHPSGDGSAYVIFGRDSSNTATVGDLGTQGFRIEGAVVADGPGVMVAGAGDVNGDGLRDVVVGANAGTSRGRTGAGTAYVVFGRASSATVYLGDLGTNGFRIDGAAAGDATGTAVGGGRDVNGDGRADVIVGAPGADNYMRPYAGAAYVVYGKPSTAPVDLAALGDGGFRVDGAAEGDEAGATVAGAGDLNGDRRPDVLVGAPLASHNDRSRSGAVYGLYGFGTPSVCYPSGIAATAGQPVEPLSPLVERTGSASFSISPALPAGLTFDPATGVVGGTPTAAAQATVHTVRMGDLAGSASTSLQVSVSDPAGAARDATAPCVSGYAMSPRRFAAGRGASFRYTLSEPARATIAIQRAQRGRRTGTRCERSVRELRRERSCKRYADAGVVERTFTRAGRKRVWFSGRLGGRTLEPGRYRAVLTATDRAGNRSRSRTATFRIVPKEHEND